MPNLVSRAVGRSWRELWPRVKKLEERQDVGKALSTDQENRLLDAADRNCSQNIRTMIRCSLLTGFRSGELSSLTWERVDFANRVLTVGRRKLELASSREVPMNETWF